MASSPSPQEVKTFSTVLRVYHITTHNFEINISDSCCRASSRFSDVSYVLRNFGMLECVLIVRNYVAIDVFVDG